MSCRCKSHESTGSAASITTAESETSAVSLARTVGSAENIGGAMLAERGHPLATLRTKAWACALILTACSHGDHGSATSGDLSGNVPRPRLGAVMSEVGRRFELAGRAAIGGKFDLAAYEADEIGELFEEDVGRAEPPQEGNPSVIAPMATTFGATFPKALIQAATSHDRAAFEAAFARTSEACNACHQASGHGFIGVPSAPGRPVPDVGDAPMPPPGPAAIPAAPGSAGKSRER